MSAFPRAAGRLAWPALLLLLVLVFHARALPPGMAFNAGDLPTYFVPVRAWLLEQVSRGEFPLWQRSIDLGFPTLASSEFALFHFTTWLFPFRPVERALTLGLLVHVALLVLGGFAWLRRRGLSHGAAGVGALTLGLGGYSSVHLLHWTFSATAMWLPWTLLALDAFIQSGRRRWFALAAVTTAAGWYGGAAQLAYFNGLLAGGYALVRVLRERSRWPILLSIPAGLLLASPILLAGMEMARLSPRAGGMTAFYAGGEYRFESLKILGTLVLPHLFGPSDAWQLKGTHFWEVTGYAGIGVLALALCRRPRSAEGWFFAIVTCVSLAACFGTDSPVWQLLHRYLPGYGQFRVPPRALYLASISLAFLAAEALDGLLSVRDWRADMTAIAAFLALGGAAAWLSSSKGAPVVHAAAALDARWAWALLGGWALLVVARRQLPAVAVAAAAVGLHFTDLSHHFSSFMSVAETHTLSESWPAVAPAPDRAAPRIALVRPNVVNRLAFHGLESAAGYSQIFSGRVLDLYVANQSGAVRDWTRTPVSGEYGEQWTNPYNPLFPLFSASRVTSSIPLRANASMNPVGKDAVGFQYDYLSPLPLASWVSTYVVQDDDTFRRGLPAFRPLETVVLAPPDSQPAPTPPAIPFSRRAVELLERTNARTRLRVDAPGEGGLVVLQDPWFPGWSVEVDGSPTPLLRANYAFMAASVPAGAHEVTFRYFPRTLPLAAGCITGVLVGLWAWGFARRRNGATAPA
jgi:hypothetical protein